ncbi:GtrA family protein [Desulfovibrio cuneatus]|uniref:GtrA family protein n=1 Tax=Desulfovibrio cuneatus TaxID=159728 RepID=UPI000486B0E2|nr:GtrA family protein [Desulfovibrio cuneatus]
MINHTTFLQFVRFCCVGVANVLVDYGVYHALGFFMPIYTARALSWIAGCLFSYTINRRWTFNARDKGLRPMVRFGVVNAASLCLGLGLLYLFTWLGCGPTVAFWLTLPFTTVSNYLGYKLWSFQEMD